MSLKAAFEKHRPLLFRLCYRMTGSAADAEDIVQETFARALEHAREDDGRELKPWLVQVALNLSRDQLRRRKRRSYTGPWLPSPLETEGCDMLPSSDREPEARYGELESVSHAFLIALEALTSSQRASVILRDVMEYSVSEAASLLKITESNLKTTHHRAREKLADYDARRVPLTAEQQQKTQEALLKLFMGLVAGDVAALEAMLARDVITINDGNGEYFAARVPIHGPERVIKFHLKVGAKRAYPAFEFRQLNGLPALVCEFMQDEPQMARRAVIAVALDPDGRIRLLNTTVASAKLARVRFDFVS